jgi:hypothetical protein
VSIRPFIWIYLIAEEGSVDEAIMRWPKFPVELISNL